MKKFLKIIISTALSCTLLLTACGGEGKGADSGNSKDMLQIGIVQGLEHEALDASRNGFISALEARGYKNEENIKLDYNNAQDDQSNLKTISQNFVSDNKDLVLAIGTQAAVTMAVETKEIPIVITAVTDPKEAKLVKDNAKPETNVTGTSDLTPVKEQIELITKLLPETKKIALFYTSSESNSKLQADMAEAAAKELGIETEHITISTSNDIIQVAESMIGRFDAVYVPTDNTVAAAMQTLTGVTNPAKLPVFPGEVGMTKGGGLASVSIDYSELGYKAGEMAADILDGKSKPADMAIEYAPNPTVVLNKKVFDSFEMEIPDDLKETSEIIE